MSIKRRAGKTLLSIKNENPRCDTKNTSNGSYTLACKGVAALPPERSPGAFTSCGGRTRQKNPVLSTKKKNGRTFYWTRVKNILTNAFYYGHFIYGGEVYEDKHKAIISKRLFDKVQTVIDRRSNNTKAIIKQPKPFCGLLKCS